MLLFPLRVTKSALLDYAQQEYGLAVVEHHTAMSRPVGDEAFYRHAQKRLEQVTHIYIGVKQRCAKGQ